MANPAKDAAPETEVELKAGAVPFYWVEGCKPNAGIVILSRSKKYNDLLKEEQDGVLEKNHPEKKKGPWTASAMIDEQILKEATVAHADPEGNLMKRDMEIALTALMNALEHNPRARLHPLGMPISKEEMKKFGIDERFLAKVK